MRFKIGWDEKGFARRFGEFQAVPPLACQAVGAGWSFCHQTARSMVMSSVRILWRRLLRVMPRSFAA